MKIKYCSALILSLLITINCFAATRYVGADVSLLPEYEDAGAQYKNERGEPINNLLNYLYDEGMRAMRVRLFVNPSDFPGNDPNACQDLEYIIPLCKRIVNDGYSLMLDFHYSDTWADPAAQWIPKAWEGLTDEELYKKIYDYTKECLETLKENGVIPAFIQPGNEISYGMLWSPYGTPESGQHRTYMGRDDNWARLGKLLNNAILACREICPEAGIVIHTERVAQIDVQNNFYNKMKELNVDYDIIGLSYYPYFHGKMSVLKNALTSLEKNFPEKQIMIVETGYPYAWEIPGTNQPVDYPYSEVGQNTFARELVETLLSFDNVTGLFWWWLEYNAFDTQLTGWYNAPLFDSRTGKVTMALKTICSFGSAAGIEKTEVSGFNDDVFYDLRGLKTDIPESHKIYIRNGKKVIIP